MNDPRMHEYLQQVSDAHPCGEDMAFSTLFDDIREARRADDSSLAPVRRSKSACKLGEISRASC